jgi:mannose-6-phosphate isomerase
MTGDARYGAIAIAATEAMLRYLDTPVAGLWYDRIGVDGKLVDEPAPASSFYHLVVAVGELSALARMP